MRIVPDVAQFSSPQRVLITGAAGFLGSHLCDAFLARGAHVFGIDNLLTGSFDNIEHLEKNPHFAFRHADVVNNPQEYLPSDWLPDIVLHFASPASPPIYQQHPVETYLVNTLGTHRLLDFLHIHAPRTRFFFASTSEVYGDPQQHPQRETYWGNVNPNGVRSCYDEAKRMGETMCGVFYRTFGMDVRIVRIFNTYGPRMDLDDGRIIPSFLRSVLEGEPLTVFGDGSQTRSYCYVDDLVRGIVSYATAQGLAGETMNLGNPEEFTVLSTAHTVRNLFPKQNLSIVHKPLPLDDPTRRRPDISKAMAKLQWQPHTALKEGLLKTFAWAQTTRDT